MATYHDASPDDHGPDVIPFMHRHSTPHTIASAGFECIHTRINRLMKASWCMAHGQERGAAPAWVWGSAVNWEVTGSAPCWAMRRKPFDARSIESMRRKSLDSVYFGFNA